MLGRGDIVESLLRRAIEDLGFGERQVDRFETFLKRYLVGQVQENIMDES